MILLKSFQRKFFQSIGLVVVMLLVVTPLIWLGLSHPEYVLNTTAIISRNSPLFMVFRWLLILVFFLFWSSIVNRLGAHYNWSTEKIEFWCNQRLKMTVWLVLFELMICENMILTIFHLIEHI